MATSYGELTIEEIAITMGIEIITELHSLGEVIALYQSDDCYKAIVLDPRLSPFEKETQARKRPLDMTLSEAIDDCIKNSDALLSPTTLEGYEKIKRTSFQDIMNLPPKYPKDFICEVKLPTPEIRSVELIPPEIIIQVIKDTPIELPVLLSMWLSFSMSEIRGLTKSKSIIGGKYLRIKEVMVDVDGEAVSKATPKTKKRNRYLEIPQYIKLLVDQVEDDQLAPLSGQAIYSRWRRLLKRNDFPHMTFHDLRHVNASVMALLNIPEKYALERGGWKTPAVMKYKNPRKNVGFCMEHRGFEPLAS